LQVEWGDLECILGRQILLKNCLREEWEAVLKNFKKVGWKVGLLPWTQGMARCPHPYAKNLLVLFCPPGSHMVGKRPERVKKLGRTGIHRNPYAEPRYVGDELETSESLFLKALRGEVDEDVPDSVPSHVPAEGGVTETPVEDEPAGGGTVPPPRDEGEEEVSATYPASGDTEPSGAG